MTLDELITYLIDTRDNWGVKGSTVVVATGDDFTEEGEFFALDTIPVNGE